MFAYSIIQQVQGHLPRARLPIPAHLLPDGGVHQQLHRVLFAPQVEALFWCGGDGRDRAAAGQVLLCESVPEFGGEEVCAWRAHQADT